jgi:hypothetical protein
MVRRRHQDSAAVVTEPCPAVAPDAGAVQDGCSMALVGELGVHGRLGLARLNVAESAGGAGSGMKPGTKLIRDQQREARARRPNGETQRSIIRSYNVSRATISRPG